MRHWHRVQNPHQRIGRLGKAKYYRRNQGDVGGSFFSSLKNGLSSLSKVVLEHGKTILPHVLKTVGPSALTLAASKLGEVASRNGVPSSVVNALGSAAQQGAKQLQNIPTQELSPGQGKISSYLTGHAQNVLSKLNSRGSGIYGVGIDGLGIYGVGIDGLGRRRKGGAVDLVQAEQTSGQGLIPPGLSYGGNRRRRGGVIDLHSASRISGTNI